MRLWIYLLQLMQARTMSTEDEKAIPDEPPVLQPNIPPEKDPVGFKDDLVFLLFLIPTICAFFPQTREYVKDGMAILNELPDWFSMIIVLCVISLFGLRKQLMDILSNFSNFRKNK